MARILLPRLVTFDGVMTMARVTPSEYREKHNRRTKAATEDMRRGVERVTESPTAKAAAKVDKMRTNLNAALDSGKWAAGLNRVSLTDWKDKMLTKGVQRVAAGVDAAGDKVEAFAAEFLPHLDAVTEKVKRMPDITLEDNLNRMVEQARGVAQFKRRQ